MKRAPQRFIVFDPLFPVEHSPHQKSHLFRTPFLRLSSTLPEQFAPVLVLLLPLATLDLEPVAFTRPVRRVLLLGYDAFQAEPAALNEEALGVAKPSE